MKLSPVLMLTIACWVMDHQWHGNVVGMAWFSHTSNDADVGMNAELLSGKCECYVVVLP